VVLFCVARLSSVAGYRTPALARYAAKNFLSLRAGSAPESEEMKAFYALGLNVARQVGGELKGILSKEELTVMIQGFTDSMNDVVPNEMEMLTTYGPNLNEILTGRANARVDTEKKNGEDHIASYMMNNLKAIKTASGLVYHETLAGTGAMPTGRNTVKVHYHGTLIDGSIFDSSMDRGQPLTFPLANVIKGWQEGVAMMKVGGKATIVVPYDLAYGNNGSPPTIPPGATLQFDVELLEIEA
jgi:FKBP-type peptidyl-prolyl cis-trans isomerase FkpA